MTHGQDFIDELGRADGARPRLVHYDLTPGGIRVELSGRTLANWAAKVANFLVDECDVEPGDAVELALPPAHWRTCVWVAGIWCAGAVAVPPSTDSDPRLIVRAVGSAPAEGNDPGAPLGILDLAPLARSAGDDLPPGAFDLNADVQTSSDVFLAPADPGAPLPQGLQVATPQTSADVADLGTLAALLAGTLPGPRPLVLVTGEVNDEALARIAADERL